MVNRLGEALFERRVRPISYVERDGDGNRVRRPPIRCTDGPRRVHGIAAEDFRGAPSFVQVYPELVEVLRGRRILVYNAAYDGGVWKQTVERYRLSRSGVEPGAWGCVMKAYAGFCGEFRYEEDGDGRLGRIPRSYRWHRLGGTHGAVEDCRATLRRICEIAGRDVPEAARRAPRTYDINDEDFDSIPF